MNSKQGMSSRVKRAIDFEQKLDMPEDKAKLEIIATEILEMENIEELEDYLK